MPNPPTVAPNAWDARPSHVETLATRRQTATRKGKPLDVVRYDDVTLFDRLLARRAITDRQHDAARIVHGWAYASGIIRHVVASLPTIDAEIVEQFDPPPERNGIYDPDAPGPRDWYRRLLRDIGAYHAIIVEAVVHGTPILSQHHAHLGSALDRAADCLGLPENDRK